MKKTTTLLLFFILVIACLSGCSDKKASTVEKIDAKTENDASGANNTESVSFTTTDLDGNIKNENILDGHKITMINIWATFCGPCRSEMPDLEKLSHAYGNEFQIIGIVTDVTDGNYNIISSQRSSARSILSSTGVTYTQLVLSESLNDLYASDIQFVPTTLFVNESGDVIGEEYVGSKNYSEWKNIVDGLLGK